LHGVIVMRNNMRVKPARKPPQSGGLEHLSF
jgi:hypothetical protein